MKNKRFHFFNHWIDFKYIDGAIWITYGRGSLMVKTLLFWEWEKPKAPPSLILDNLGMEIKLDG